jgi:hypothetical protein
MTTGKFFNRGVMALDSPYIGHVIRETEDKIVVFGEIRHPKIKNSDDKQKCTHWVKTR